MDPPISVGSIIAGKYRVDRQIGAGGMGKVVAASHLELDQPVAIKFLNAETGGLPEAVERFKREARAASRIHSEHVVRVLDVGVLNERIPFMVMELLIGNDLESELVARGPLPVEVAVTYVLQAIDAIAEAHSIGIVHRDLKPTNLFLAQRFDGTRLIKVLDFGISKIAGLGPEAALTRSASMFGSPLYMSPEQMRSAKDVDARTDIWSLGAILYELVSGRPPFVSDSLPSLCIAVMNDPVRPLREHAPGAPPAFEAVLNRCLARDIRERFESVAELAEALVPFAPGGQVHADRALRLLPRRTDGSATVRGLPYFAQERLTPNRSSFPAPPDARDASAPGVGGTQGSWGGTGLRAMVKRRVGIIIGAVMLLGATAAFFVVSHLSFKDADAPSPGPALPLVTANAQAPAALASAIAPVPSAMPAETQAPAAPPVEAPAPPSTTPPLKPVAPVRPAVPPSRVTREPIRRAPREKTASAQGLTDFGGRVY